MHKLTIEEMQTIASERGGKCLSNEYINNRSKLKWQCKEDHIWETKPNTIKNGSWCPICSIIDGTEGRQRLTIEEMRDIAAERGGKCLSNEYRGAHNKLKWQCKEGHIWEAKPYLIKDGTWCPKCRIWIGENTCRCYMEYIFKSEFPKSKPKWLKNDKGNQMELDGYCKNLKLAFEYQGIQHYKADGWFGEDKVRKIKYRDEQKQKICMHNGVNLLIIPYSGNLDLIHDLIINECKRLNISIPQYNNTKLNYINFPAYLNNNLDQLKKIAQDKGGELISKTYLSSKTNLLWKCKNGHIWHATPASIRKGTWCAICAGKMKLTIEEMQSIATEHGGKCLSSKYINGKSKLKWKCIEGHIWEAAAHLVKGAVGAQFVEELK